MNHNAIGRGYETFGNATAETVTRTLDERDVTREWYRPLPAPRTFRWSMRNNTNYMQTAALAILDYTARHAKDMLRRFYQKGYNSWRRGLTTAPYAFAIPDGQADRRRVADMIDLLRAQRIEVARATAPFTAGERHFPAGTFLLPLDQPYRNYAVDLLTPQQFPADAEHEPYDDISWALPLHFGVEVVPIADASIRDVPVASVTSSVRAAGRISGAGTHYVLADTGQEALLAARFRLRDFRVEIAEESFTIDGTTFAAGSWRLPSQPGLGAAVEGAARELDLDFMAVASSPNTRMHDAPVPRLGIWVPWADTDSIGWIRYVLDQRKVPYVYLRDEDVRAGNLRDRVDVIVYGHVRMDLAGQIHGIQAVAGPMPFTKTDRYPSHGEPVESDDITGGIGWSGLASLQAFLEAGGLLVTLGNGSTLALDGGLVPNVRRSGVTGVTTPGAELRARFVRPDHPIAYGYAPEITVFRSNYPIYDAPLRWRDLSYCTACLEGPPDRGPIVLEWGGMAAEGSAPPGIIVSGGGRNSGALHGKPAVFDVPVGAGRIVAFNFNPIHRDLNRSDFRLLWNILLNWTRRAR
jgi:hypothetical protein